MEIGPGGVTIFPRYSLEAASWEPPPSLDLSRRLASGVAGLDALLGGGLLERSVTLLSGSPGTGKTTLGLQFLLAGAEAGEPGLYVSLEEGPDQIRDSAVALGLSLQGAVDGGLLHLLYLSRYRADQFFSLLAEPIERYGVRRLVLDSVSHLSAENLPPKTLQEILYSLVGRFKKLGVTSLLTIEAAVLCSIEPITGLGLSPVADNLIVLRYRREQEHLAPSLTIVKTRGSPHDTKTHAYTVGPGGIRLGREGGR
jgi:circadian clock protein KaiC